MTRTATIHAVLLVSSTLIAIDSAAAQSDWDLYSLRLVNRARHDPAAEPAILGSTVTDPSAPLPPLAYDERVGDAAANHNNWMFQNLGGIASGSTPDSFTHYETLNGAKNGTPAVGTPGYTGATPQTRLTAAGFAWSASGENIAVAASTESLPVNAARIEANHLGWWESAGHRANMLGSSFTAYGHAGSSLSAPGPLGGLPSIFDNLHFATQNFGRPLLSPKSYALGLLFADLDADGEWTPKDSQSPLREGLGGVAYDVYLAGSTVSPIASGTTMENGAFSVALGDASYDVYFALPAGRIAAAKGVVMQGANVDAGDLTSELLRVDTTTVDVSSGGAQTFTLQAGPAFANKSYLILGSASGTSPGLPLGGVTVPLVFDAYMSLSIALVNGPTHTDTLGTLDAFGTATAAIQIPSGLSPSLAGLVLHHAYVVFQGVPGSSAVLASNAVPLTFVP